MTDLITMPRRTRPPTAEPGGKRSLRQRLLRRRPGEGTVLFAVSAVLYLGVGLLMVKHNILFADAISRVGNGYYVMYSRSRHLPAVGFVWNPLPSLVLLPLLPFKALFPVLVTRGLAGNVQSAMFMAGGVALMASSLRALRVPRVPRLLLTVVFAVQPMILLYAGSGLSEPMLLFFLLLTVSALIPWTRDLRPGRLVTAGLALGFAYMTRYEAVGPALAVGILVGLVSWRAARGSVRFRTYLALNDVALVGVPFAFAFGMWAVMAKVLVGEWLPTFSSRYGNSAQVSSGRGSIQSVTGATLLDTVAYAERQISGLVPMIVPLLLLALVAAVRHRGRMPALVPVVVMGGVLAFDNIALVTHKSFGWLRFQIAVIPLSVLLAGYVLAAVSTPGRLRAWSSQARVVAVAAVTAMVAGGLPVQAHTLTTTRGGLAREESAMLRSTFFPKLANHEELKSLNIFKTERQIARYIDALHPTDGLVLTDTAYAYSVVLASTRPRRFVITSDLDFKAYLADPAGHDVGYLLVPAPNLGPADALQHHWPNLYQTGGGVGVFVKEWPGQFYGNWRLFRVQQRAVTPSRSFESNLP